MDKGTSAPISESDDKVNPTDPLAWLGSLCDDNNDLLSVKCERCGGYVTLTANNSLKCRNCGAVYHPEKIVTELVADGYAGERPAEEMGEAQAEGKIRG